MHWLGEYLEFVTPRQSILKQSAGVVISRDEQNLTFGTKFADLNRLRLAVDAEKLAHQAHIRAAGELHPLRAVMQMEMLREGFGERRRARPARVNERAVNVE